MPTDKLIVRMTEEELAYLNDCAKNEGMPLSDYVKSRLLPNRTQVVPLEELLDQVMKGIEELDTNELFSLPDFFEGKYWRKLSKGIRLHLGKTFKQMVDNGEVSHVRFEGYLSNNMAQYRKI